MATIKLTNSKFKEEILNYEVEQDWNYKGQLPAIIDFYADWCSPCKMIAPVLEAISEEFKDQLLIYKVDTEAEQELAAVFGIQSIPSLLFIPTEGVPMMQAGALSKNALKQIITEKLLMKEKFEDVK